MNKFKENEWVLDKNSNTVYINDIVDYGYFINCNIIGIDNKQVTLKDASNNEKQIYIALFNKHGIKKLKGVIMKLVKPNVTGLNREKICEMLEGDVSFLNEFCVNGEYLPVAVFHSSNPDISKGHKEFILVQQDQDQLMIRGMDKKTILPFSSQSALHCLECDDVIYSVYRHDMRSCSCKAYAIDGGKDYTKVSYLENTKMEMCFVDLLTDQITKG